MASSPLPKQVGLRGAQGHRRGTGTNPWLKVAHPLHTSVPYFAHQQNGSRISLNLYLELVNPKIMEIMEEDTFTKKASLVLLSLGPHLSAIWVTWSSRWEQFSRVRFTWLVYISDLLNKWPIYLQKTKLRASALVGFLNIIVSLHV